MTGPTNKDFAEQRERKMLEKIQELQESDEYYQVPMDRQADQLGLQEGDLVVFKNDTMIYTYKGIGPRRSKNPWFKPIDETTGFTIPQPILVNVPVSFIFRKRKAHYFNVNIVREAHEIQTMKAFSREELVQRLEHRNDIISYIIKD